MRQEIARLLQKGSSYNQIARYLRVSPSTILREINRNINEYGVYIPEVAQEKTIERQIPRFFTSAETSKLSEEVRNRIAKAWNYKSPALDSRSWKSKVPTLMRHKLIVDKYLNDYAPGIEGKIISSKAAMRALAAEFQMEYTSIYKLLKKKGVYIDRYTPVCHPQKK